MAPLMALRIEPGLSSAQLARWSYVTPQSMNEVVIALERDGLIERRPDGENRRILRAYLTAAGRRRLDEWEEAIARLEDRMFTGFSGRQLDDLTEVLKQCAENARAPSKTGRGGKGRSRTD